MKIISNKRCVIGEGPVWNEKEGLLYYTNGMEKEICMLDVYTGELKIRPVEIGVAAMAFTKDNRLIVSRHDGVFILNKDNTREKLYDVTKTKIRFANDMKVGPDGSIYVGTQSGRRAGISDKIDGKLYRIDKTGNVHILLENLGLSNGLEWSIDEKYFYHTDSDTHTIKEYSFDKISGNIEFTGRMVKVEGVDGLTINRNNDILAACWGKGHIAVVDTTEFKIKSYIDIPAGIPASCAFSGNNMEFLAVVTACFGADTQTDVNAGFTFVCETNDCGRTPYLFG